MDDIRDSIIDEKLRGSYDLLKRCQSALVHCTLGLCEASELLMTTKRRIEVSQALLHGENDPEVKAFSWWQANKQDSE
ncbi:MAG: hypothetical protein IT168_03250 [Bryobacterales bacterium]|nr:hypothetical protein [Bryobacterales bacterium]